MVQPSKDVVTDATAKELLRRWLSNFVMVRAQVQREYVFSYEVIAKEAGVSEIQVNLITSCVAPSTQRGFGLQMSVRPDFTVSIVAGRHPEGGKALVVIHEGHGQILTWQADAYIRDWISNLCAPSPLRMDLFGAENPPTSAGIFVAKLKSSSKGKGVVLNRVVLSDWHPITHEEWKTYVQSGEYPWKEYGEMVVLT